MMSTSAKKTRHIPQRTCIACRRVKDKQELVRLVCTPEKNIEVDISGKKSGRGAYLCKSKDCWETGLNGNRLEHTLRATIAPDSREFLIKFGQDNY